MLSPWYITGFCDGEAAFTYSKSGRRNINLYFSIKIRGDDRLLLVEIQKFFGVGKIYAVKPRIPGYHSGFTAAAAFYRVTRAADLLGVVRHFDAYPLCSKKAKSYRAWREMVLLKNKQFRKPAFAKLQQLAQELSSLNSKNKFLTPENV